MYQVEPVHISPNALTPRRTFLRSSLLLTVPLMLGGTAFSAAAATYTAPTRARGGARVSVRDAGARGNGTADDTNAFQRAINSLPSTGGSIYVPTGTYLIDAETSVRLRSRTHLQMASGAKLVAKRTSKGRYRVLVADGVHDVEISGGQIIGERDRHVGTSGEGGHGIKIEGSERITIRDIRISKCWGDGIVVGPKPVRQAPYIMSHDVVVANVVCTGNRRNGLSIGNVTGMKVYDSEFSNTHGTSPQCGIDVEPDKDFDGRGYCDNVHIENCLIRDNAAYGFNVWKRSRNLTVTKCVIEGNKSCGLVTRGLRGARITQNTIRYNRSTGVFIQEDTVDCLIRYNTFKNNYTRQGITEMDNFSLVGVTSKVQKHLIIGRGTSNIRVGRNYYR